MNAKSVVNFLVLRSAFTQRNFTSLLLVGVFVAVYIFSGGKISTVVPTIPTSTTFGGLPQDAYPAVDPRANPATSSSVQQKALQVLGVKPSADRSAREQSSNERGRLFSPDEAVSEKIDKNGLISADEEYQREEAKLRRQERRPGDSLAIIEERLNIKRR